MKKTVPIFQQPPADVTNTHGTETSQMRLLHQNKYNDSLTMIEIDKIDQELGKADTILINEPSSGVIQTRQPHSPSPMQGHSPSPSPFPIIQIFEVSNSVTDQKSETQVIELIQNQIQIEDQKQPQQPIQSRLSNIVPMKSRLRSNNTIQKGEIPGIQGKSISPLRKIKVGKIMKSFSRTTGRVMAADFSTSKLTQSNKDIANLLDTSISVERIGGKKFIITENESPTQIQPGGGQSESNSPIHMQPVMQEIKEQTTIQDNSSLNIIKPEKVQKPGLNQMDISFHFKSVEQQFEEAKKQVQIIEKHSKPGRKDVMLSPRFKDSQTTVFGYAYNSNLQSTQLLRQSTQLLPSFMANQTEGGDSPLLKSKKILKNDSLKQMAKVQKAYFEDSHEKLSRNNDITSTVSPPNLDQSHDSSESQPYLFGIKTAQENPDYLQELSRKNKEMQQQITQMMLQLQPDPFSKQEIQQIQKTTIEKLRQIQIQTDILQQVLNLDKMIYQQSESPPMLRVTGSNFAKEPSKIKIKKPKYVPPPTEIKKELSLLQMTNDLRLKNKMQDISIEQIILTKQLSSTNCYQRQDQDPLDQYIENLENSQTSVERKFELVKSSRLLMANESLNYEQELLKDFGLSKLDYSGIAAPIRQQQSKSVLISGEHNLQKLSLDLIEGMNQKTFNKRAIIHIKQNELMKVQLDSKLKSLKRCLNQRYEKFGPQNKVKQKINEKIENFVNPNQILDRYKQFDMEHTTKKRIQTQSVTDFINETKSGKFNTVRNTSKQSSFNNIVQSLNFNYGVLKSPNFEQYRLVLPQINTRYQESIPTPIVNNQTPVMDSIQIPTLEKLKSNWKNSIDMKKSRFEIWDSSRNLTMTKKQSSKKKQTSRSKSASEKSETDEIKKKLMEKYKDVIDKKGIKGVKIKKKNQEVIKMNVSGDIIVPSSNAATVPVSRRDSVLWRSTQREQVSSGLATKKSKYQVTEKIKPKIDMEVVNQTKNSYDEFRKIVKPWGELHSEPSTEKNDNNNHYLSTQYDNKHTLLGSLDNDSIIGRDINEALLSRSPLLECQPFVKTGSSDPFLMILESSKFEAVQPKQLKLLNKTRVAKRSQNRFYPRSPKPQKILFCSEPYGQIKPKKLKIPISKIFEDEPTSLIKKSKIEIDVQKMMRNSQQY